MTSKTQSADERIRRHAEQAVAKCAFIAPEDVEARVLKIYHQMQKVAAPLHEIHDLLDGKEWSSNTMSEVADVLRRAGYSVREPSDG